MKFAFRRNSSVPAAALLSVAAMLGGCVKNPVTGHHEFSLVSEKQEIAMGRQAQHEVAATYGVYNDPKTQVYLNELGMKLAKNSERPNLPWSFQILDDASLNAFALPGGQIYVTRGMMTHLTSEAELAGVLGHEIGHVTARHSARRMSQAQLAQVGLLAGMIIKPELARYGQLAQLGVGLLFLKNSRDDERQADSLGLRYMTESHYSAPAMVGVFSLLRDATDGSQRGRLPTWLSTHPDPENRIKRTQQGVAKLAVSPEVTRLERERYLRYIDGMVYGEDPREGYFEGNTFVHPAFAFQMAVPPGWERVNQKAGMTAVSPRQDAALQITLARASSPRVAAMQFLQQRGVRVDRPQTLDLNGMPAVASRFMAATQSGTVSGLAVFVAHQNQVFQVLSYGSARSFMMNESILAQSLSSFRRLTDPAALNRKPRRVQLVELDKGVSLREFAAAYPSARGVELKNVALLNQVAPEGKLEAGLAKRVIEVGPAIHGTPAATSDGLTASTRPGTVDAIH